MERIQTFQKFNESTQTKINFTKQTMRMKVDWFAAKDFDVYYKYNWTRHRISNDENGCNFPNGVNGQLADTSVLRYISKYDVESMYDYASKYGGSPKPAFTVKKNTKCKVTVGKYETLYIEILDGDYAGKEFYVDLIDFTTCLVGFSNDESLVVSKYRIFLNGKPLKAKYYTDMGKIKTALRVAFKFPGSDDNDDENIPEYIYVYDEHKIDKSDLKNVQIMRYDNNSKIPVPVDFNVENYYEEMMMKKGAKKYNL